ncbi:cupin domain-containing protein [Polaromonas sp.]|uniref:cupin domain-containing protein n=1 Tax=Polaromonas sp. TaxID=1869339 RepID=UPI002731F207|nr:cupin domain-containing protein [Polaromonas sp.]MDP1886062.1 cupin domain-containing protein [Polaromonas sp.]
MKLAMLNGLTAQQFLSEYWQKKPLLIRSAFPGFKDFVSLESLQTLAQRDDVLSRLIAEREGEWSVKQGPLKASNFRGLKRAHWSFLVQGIDQLVPAGKALLSQFDFIPHARLDDLMISFAPKDGGVGPHFDSYDVFLLQGQGHKRWQVSQQPDHELIPDAPIRILRHFKMEQEWILGPGDMLYLPPRYAHYGIALNDCLTYSIGFRAASYQELLTQFLIHLQDRATAEGTYEDADLKSQAHPAEISASMIDKVAAAIKQLTWSKDDIAQFLGSYLSEPKPHIFFDAPARPLSYTKFHQAVEKRGLHLSLKSQMLFVGEQIFMNGEQVIAQGAARKLLIHLADRRVLPGPLALPEAAGALLYDWYQAGYVELG